MLAFLIIGTIAGILLGLRFTVFVLVPASLLAIGAIILNGHGLKMIILTGIGTFASLQIGYIVGCIARACAGAYLRARSSTRYGLRGSESVF